VEAANLTGLNWSIVKGIDKFIGKAGGCSSPILAQLETNILKLFYSMSDIENSKTSRLTNKHETPKWEMIHIPGGVYQMGELINVGLGER
tara:strand:+ start:3034 stop:3303 length:270 start_codon:yes stop_codon:yes gene_type:complete